MRVTIEGQRIHEWDFRLGGGVTRLTENDIDFKNVAEAQEWVKRRLLDIMRQCPANVSPATVLRFAWGVRIGLAPKSRRGEVVDQTLRAVQWRLALTAVAGAAPVDAVALVWTQVIQGEGVGARKVTPG